MRYRKATMDDVELLAAFNKQLVEDEGHRNASMSVPELAERMRGFLTGGYEAAIFEQAGRPVAYALWRDGDEGIYLRQFLVCRGNRRRGLGRQAIATLRREVWPPDRRIIVGVLAHNKPAEAFWRAMGFADYAITLELSPPGPAEPGP